MRNSVNLRVMQKNMAHIIFPWDLKVAYSIILPSSILSSQGQIRSNSVPKFPSGHASICRVSSHWYIPLNAPMVVLFLLGSLWWTRWRCSCLPPAFFQSKPTPGAINTHTHCSGPGKNGRAVNWSPFPHSRGPNQNQAQTALFKGVPQKAFTQ